MENYSPQKLKIFLWLALQQATPAVTNEGVLSEPDFAPLEAQLSATDAEKFVRLKQKYQSKSVEEQQKWQKQIEQLAGENDSLFDKNIHWTHFEAALNKEIPAICKIIVPSLPPAQQKYFEHKISKTENFGHQNANLENVVCRAFAKQFVTLSDFPSGAAFDRLSGEQFARLVRLAGIREVAFACVRITAVESVAAFLRRFPAEDARAIAAQLSSLPQVSDERLAFAENIVQTALEDEPQPSAMLDLLGIWLVGILLCNELPERIAYTSQKLPLEVAPKLSEIIETQCLQTPENLRSEIGAEIEQLAGMIRQPAHKNETKR